MPERPEPNRYIVTLGGHHDKIAGVIVLTDRVKDALTAGALFELSSEVRVSPDGRRTLVGLSLFPKPAIDVIETSTSDPRAIYKISAELEEGGSGG